MQKKELHQWLNERSASPTPHIHADPFLPARIRAIHRENDDGHLSWPLRSMLAAAALLLGVYVGNVLTDTGYESNNAVNAYSSWSSALFQESVGDNLIQLTDMQTENYHE